MVGTDISTYEEIEIQKHAEKESYAGVCDEINLGVTLYYLQNVQLSFRIPFIKNYSKSKRMCLSALSRWKNFMSIQKKQKEQSAYSKNKEIEVN